MNDITMARRYCTYFDHRYAARGIAMIRSLRRHEPNARVWVLCLDDMVHDLFDKIDEPGVEPVRFSELERSDSALVAARDDGRTRMEYYFTCTASFVRYVMRTAPDLEWVTYLDGDLWFFASPEPVYREIRDASVAIIPHRFPLGQRARRRYGTYNVGWVSFRRTADGEACLDWWRERCLEWCMDFVDEANDRFADQRYLDRFCKLFSGVHIVENPGANLAPWNIAGHEMRYQGSNIAVDGQDLIFFHFHGLKRLGSRLFLTWLGSYGASLDPAMREHIYRPYLHEMLNVRNEIAPFIPKLQNETLRHGATHSSTVLALLRSLRNFVYSIKGLLSGRGVWLSDQPYSTKNRASR